LASAAFVRAETPDPARQPAADRKRKTVPAAVPPVRRSNGCGDFSFTGNTGSSGNYTDSQLKTLIRRNKVFDMRII
jgi:hypothetical protein